MSTWPDMAAFAESAPRHELFAGHPGTIFIARAPGRLDVMGGIADYSGSLVLEMPIREAALCAAQSDQTHRLRIVSLGADEQHRTLSFEMMVPELLAMTYDEARTFFARDPKQHWAAYIAGTLLVLSRERGVKFSGGVRLLLDSAVPEGKGVSSSAAIEVAAMQAVAAMVGENIEPRELAIVCQKVENLVVGAPCGVMDQMTAACGEAGKLMALLCQPAELRGMVSIPEELAVWGIDSGIRHAVSGADYGSVRVGAFMGRKIITNGSGYLANISPSKFDPSQLPETIPGAEFLARYGETGDPVTRIDPARTYAVRVPTMHPIHEHFRVSLFAELLPVRAGKLLGELMYQSHAGYSACGLGSAGTDRLVALAREEGLLGAKITGGGSGGTVAVLGWREDDGKLQRVVSRYAEETGRAPFVFEGSSPGVVECGVLTIRRK